MWNIAQHCAVFFLVFIANVNTLKIIEVNDPIHRLTHLVSNKHKKPLVVVLDTAKHQRSQDLDEPPFGSIDGLVEDVDGDPDANEDAAYILNYLLRTSHPERMSDPRFTGTKEILRQALRVRCSRVDDCIIKCPPVEPYCPLDCKKVFDNLNLCPPRRPKRPKKKKKDCRPKCGKTMPPKWRFF